MPELPRNQEIVSAVIGDLLEGQDQKPFHLRSLFQTTSGKYSGVGLAVGKSWIEHRHAVAIPLVPDAAPTDATSGVWLPVYPQARVYLEFVGGNGNETLTYRIWHRHRSYDDALSVGPWTRWKDIDSAHHLVEYLDAGLFHREIYIQLVSYSAGGPPASPATAVHVWVAGAEGVTDSSLFSANVKVEAGDIEVQIEAIPDDAGEKADSAIVAGTTDGAVPTAAGGASTKTYALRVYPDGRSMSYLQEQLLQAAISGVETTDDAIDRLDRISGRLDFGTAPIILGHSTPPTFLTTTAPAWSRARQLPFIGNLQGLPTDLRLMMLMGYRKVVGTDAGSVSAIDDVTHIRFTGVNLTGIVDRVYDINTGTEHKVTSVTDPAGAAAGTLVVDPALGAISDTVLIPYRSYPHFGNSAADALRTLAVAAPPKGVNGPAVLLSSAALAEIAGSYDIDVPVANYDQITVGVYIDAAAGDTYQIDLYARIDDQAAGDWHIVNTQFTASGATALGAAADPCELIACATNRRMFCELRVRRTKVNNNGNAVARIWIMLGR